MRNVKMVAGGEGIPGGHNPEDAGTGSSSRQDNQPQYTILLIPGAGHKSSTWDLVTPPLVEQGHEVIALDFPNEDLDMTLKNLVGIARESIRGRKNIFAVSHSRGGVPLSYMLDGMSKEEDQEDYRQVRGAATISYGGAHNIALEPEEERYTQAFYDATGKDSKGRMVFKKDHFKEAFLNDVLPPDLVQKAKDDLTAQTNLTESEIKGTPLIPVDIPWYWFAGRRENAHRISRVRRVVEHIDKLRPDSPVQYYEMESGHTPQIEIPATLASVILYCASEAYLGSLKKPS